MFCLESMLDPIDTDKNYNDAPLVVDINPPTEIPSSTCDPGFNEFSPPALAQSVTSEELPQLVDYKPPVFYGVGFITDVPTIEIKVAPRKVHSHTVMRRKNVVLGVSSPPPHAYIH